MSTYFVRAFTAARKDKTVLERVYDARKVAKALGRSEMYAKLRLHEMEMSGHARSAGKGAYKLSMNGLLELGMEEIGNELERLNRLADDLIQLAPDKDAAIMKQAERLERGRCVRCLD